VDCTRDRPETRGPCRWQHRLRDRSDGRAHRVRRKDWKQTRWCG